MPQPASTDPAPPPPPPDPADPRQRRQQPACRRARSRILRLHASSSASANAPVLPSRRFASSADSTESASICRAMSASRAFAAGDETASAARASSASVGAKFSQRVRRASRRVRLCLRRASRRFGRGIDIPANLRERVVERIRGGANRARVRSPGGGGGARFAKRGEIHQSSVVKRAKRAKLRGAHRAAEPATGNQTRRARRRSRRRRSPRGDRRRRRARRRHRTPGGTTRDGATSRLGASSSGCGTPPPPPRAQPPSLESVASFAGLGPCV